MHAELCDEIQAVRIKNLPEKFSDTKYLQEADAREPHVDTDLMRASGIQL